MQWLGLGAAFIIFISTSLEAIATRLEAMASRVGGPRYWKKGLTFISPPKTSASFRLLTVCLLKAGLRDTLHLPLAECEATRNQGATSVALLSEFG